jgi:16S rRNA (adenine1518-N6/adenine1519-N6)-dimethyltransferase
MSSSRREHSREHYPPTLKRLGQHFLTDESVLHRIVDALDITASDTVVEIGPGRGALTDLLVERAGRLVAVELDRALAAILRDRYKDRDSVEIIEADILETSLEAIAGKDYLLAGNVPYYITTPILFHTLIPPMPRRAVFLVQHEVAERAVATPGGKIYGALSVNLQVAATVEHLFMVPPGAFRPPPAVTSAVMRVTPLSEPLVAEGDRLRFQSFVQSIFGLRRKQMIRVVRTIAAMPVEQASELLQRLEIDPTARPEVLAPADFARLFRAIRKGER